jgi:hypothetical protein
MRYSGNQLCRLQLLRTKWGSTQGKLFQPTLAAFGVTHVILDVAFRTDGHSSNRRRGLEGRGKIRDHRPARVTSSSRANRYREQPDVFHRSAPHGFSDSPIDDLKCLCSGGDANQLPVGISYLD